MNIKTGSDGISRKNIDSEHLHKAILHANLVEIGLLDLVGSNLFYTAIYR